MCLKARPLATATTPCPSCGKQPYGVLALGPGKYYLECPPCTRKTPRFASLELAVAEWEAQAGSNQPATAQAA